MGKFITSCHSDSPTWSHPRALGSRFKHNFCLFLITPFQIFLLFPPNVHSDSSTLLNSVCFFSFLPCLPSSIPYFSLPNSKRSASQEQDGILFLNKMKEISQKHSRTFGDHFDSVSLFCKSRWKRKKRWKGFPQIISSYLREQLGPSFSTKGWLSPNTGDQQRRIREVLMRRAGNRISDEYKTKQENVCWIVKIHIPCFQWLKQKYNNPL